MRYDRKDDFNFIRWAQAVKQRDRWTCQICDRRGVELNSHHINGWDSFPDERYDLDNGVTLCKFHHEEFHNQYGYGGNTVEQYEEYYRVCRLMLNSIQKKQKVQDIAQHIILDLKEKIEKEGKEGKEGKEK